MRTKWGFVLAASALAVAGGVGIFVLNQPTGRRAANPAPRDDSPPLQIADDQEVPTTEFGFTGQRDFWFENQRDNYVTVGVELKDCQCARVQICRAPDAWKKLSPEERRNRASDPALTWETLEQEGKGSEVPPRAAGLLRLHWKGSKVGDQRFWAQLWVDDQDRRLYQRIDVLVQVVQPVLIRAEDKPKRTSVDVGRLNAGEERTARFLCTSGTRARFALTSAPPRADPCIQYGPPEPLTVAELKALSEKSGAAVLSGYRVTVTVRERAGDAHVAQIAQLDIGPFRRQVIWNTDLAQGHQVSSVVSGSVQGEIKLADAAGKPFIDMGKIPPNDPAPVMFTLESDDPRLELTVDEKHTLDILAVELPDGKEGKPIPSGKRWRVRVVYRQDSNFFGKFPMRDRAGYDTDVACSVVFKVSRQPTSDGAASHPLRRLFVPMRGVVLMAN